MTNDCNHTILTSELDKALRCRDCGRRFTLEQHLEYQDARYGWIALMLLVLSGILSVGGAVAFALWLCR